MTGQETRNKLTDYWREHDIKAGQEFAILTNVIHQEWTGLSVKEHREAKGLSGHNLRCFSICRRFRRKKHDF